MDLSRVVWYLLYPTTIENLSYSISGGYKSRVMGNARRSLFKWVDIRVIPRKGSTNLELRIRASNNEPIPNLVQQIKEIK